MYQQIEEYNEPREILTQLKREGQIIDAEMSASEHGFLCGLIERFSPQKLVEVGVAAGGTSAVILQCIQRLDLDTEMYSVDLSERFYRVPEKVCGYLIHAAGECGISLSHHTLMLGKVVAARLEEIGRDIDFLILDTTHSMPGENLDFLACFPYLKNDAVVVLHDTALHLRGLKKSFSYATSILFQTVVANKFLNNTVAHPNIVAFQITEDTSKYIADVFAALMIPWKYIPEAEQLHEYEAVLTRHYPEDCMRLYHQAKKKMIALDSQRVPYVELWNTSTSFARQNVLLYGTKNMAHTCFLYLAKHGIEVTGFVVSDGYKEADLCDGLPVYNFSEIPYNKTETLIIQANMAKEVTAILEASDWKWLKIDHLL